MLVFDGPLTGLQLPQSKLPGTSVLEDLYCNSSMRSSPCTDCRYMLKLARRQVAWLAFTLALYFVFFRLRNQPLIKFRDVRVVTVFVLAVAALFCFTDTAYMLVCSFFLHHNTTYTFNIHIQQQGTGNRYAEACATSIITLYMVLHVLRSVRVLYIYKW
jgi:hypothetical protein